MFGGTPADRSLPCRLFTSGFKKENEEFEEREFDFMFRHGTLVLRVEEDHFGRITPIVSCVYTPVSTVVQCFVRESYCMAFFAFNRT